MDRAQAEGLVDVAYTETDSPVGRLLVAVTDRGLVRVSFQRERREDVLEELAERLSPRVLEAPRRLDEVRRELDQYFQGERTEFELPLDWSLTSTPFQKAQQIVAGFQKAARESVHRMRIAMPGYRHRSYHLLSVFQASAPRPPGPQEFFPQADDEFHAFDQQHQAVREPSRNAGPKDMSAQQCPRARKARKHRLDAP